MSRCLLIDGNNILMRSQSVFKEAKNDAGLPIGGLYGLLESVRRFLIQESDINSVIFVIDAGVPQWRFEAAPEYKANRRDKSPDDERVYQDAKLQIPHLRKVTRWLGCGFVRAEGYEADDSISSLIVRRLKDHAITVFSSDKDFLELVDGERVKLYNPLDHIYRDPSYNYLFERLLDPKQGDNLDGVKGIGKVGASLLLDAVQEAWEHSHTPEEPWLPQGKAGLAAFFEICEYLTTGKTEVKSELKIQKLARMVLENRDKVTANYIVTSGRRIAKRVDEVMEVKCHAPDFAKFKEIVTEYGLRPVYESFNSYKLVFGRLNHDFLMNKASV
jgi:DNA polymerase-1